MKAKEFRVQDNRLLFKCPYCGKRRNYTILNNRRKSLRCMECGKTTRCLFNRRPEQRECQSGMLTLTTWDGQEIAVMMRDISSRGVGFEVLKGKDMRLLKKGKEVSLTCNWRPAMIPKSRFMVRSINGFRVGVQASR